MSQSQIFIWFNIYQFDSWFENFLFLYILLSWNFKFNFMKYEIKIQFVPMYFRFLFKWNNNFSLIFWIFLLTLPYPFFYVSTIYRFTSAVNELIHSKPIKPHASSFSRVIEYQLYLALTQRNSINIIYINISICNL